MATPIPYKYYTREGQFGPEYTVEASSNTPYGYTEISKDAFIAGVTQQLEREKAYPTQQAANEANALADRDPSKPRIGAGRRYDANQIANLTKILSEVQAGKYDGPSNLVMDVDPLTGETNQMTLQEQALTQQNQAAAKAGTMAEIQPGVYVPTGSAGHQNWVNPGSVQNQTLPGPTNPVKIGVSDGPVVPGVTPGSNGQAQQAALQNTSNSNQPGSIPSPSASPSLPNFNTNLPSAPTGQTGTMPTAPTSAPFPSQPTYQQMPSAPSYQNTSTIQQPTFGQTPTKPQLQQVPANTYTAPDVSPYFQQYQSLLAMSQGEKDAQTKLNQLDASRNQSFVNLEGQPIAMPFVTGQQAAVNKQYELSKLPLQNQLILAQMDRSSKLQAASAQLDHVKWQSDQAIQQRKLQIDELLANNQITQQQYENELRSLQMQNDQSQQTYQNQMQALQYQNSLTQQQYENQFGQTQYQNNLAQQQYENQFGQTQYQNKVEQQKYDNTRQSALDVAAANKPYEINAGNALVSPTGQSLFQQPSLSTQNASIPSSSAGSSIGPVSPSTTNAVAKLSVSQKSKLADYVTDVQSFKSKQEALASLEANETAIKTEVGEAGYTLLKAEIDKKFPYSPVPVGTLPKPQTTNYSSYTPPAQQNGGGLLGAAYNFLFK